MDNAIQHWKPALNQFMILYGDKFAKVLSAAELKKTSPDKFNSHHPTQDDCDMKSTTSPIKKP